MRFIDQLRDTWDADTLEVTGEHIHAADRVVASFSWHGLGHGPQSNMKMTTIYTVRKRKIRSMEFFWDRNEALEAAGLSE